MSKVQINFELIPGGVEIYLTEETRAFLRKVSERVQVDRWDSYDNLHLLGGLAKLQAIIQEDEAENRIPRVKVLEDGNGYFLNHATVAQLTDAQATSLGLPPTSPYQLRISASGPLLDSKTKINAKWHSSARQIIEERVGAFLIVGREYYRISDPSYSALEAIGSFNSFSEGTLDDRLSRLAGMNGILIDGADGDKVTLEQRLKDLRISHATTFSLDLRQGDTGIEFDPLLFSQDIIDEIDETGEQITESANVLTSHQQQHFANNLFKRYEEARSAYVVDQNTYLFIDPALKPALNVVRDIQKSDSDQKRKFVKNPTAFIKDKILDGREETPELTDLIEGLFVETTGFSERVQSLGIWIPKPIPWLQRESNSWMPEKFGLKIGETLVSLTDETLPTVITKIEDAIRSNVPFVSIEDSNTSIPATEDTLSALKELETHIKDHTQQQRVDDGVDLEGQDDQCEQDLEEEKLKPNKHVLLLEDNVEVLQYMSQFKPRSEYTSPVIPELMKLSPKPHQCDGIGWLQEAWCKGFPGVLLADDMGVGKTYQTLAFLTWLQDKRRIMGLPKQPILIVAPTSLLANWRDEEIKHLREPGLKNMGILYGAELKAYKDNTATNDVKSGMATLNLSRLRECDWLLTTYETLRDYHISLAALKFSCVVFDEMQRVKNPRSLNTHASKALNADFSLGLTGTPIENTLADLWCILDTLLPGLLSDLKSFIEAYPESDQEKLKELHDKLLTRTSDMPSPLLRRMKSDIAEGLPEKIEHVVDDSMQGLQEKEYSLLINGVKNGNVKAGIEFLQGIRMVSLHPVSPGDKLANDIISYINESARLKTTFNILDQIHSRGEKALIFLESLDLQEWLAYAIKLRYKMAKLPARIYGGVAAEERKRIVDRFQDSGASFNVMILSPKAGGVGLTITAATNVIHLSRWWNPAVEDQCTDRAYRIGQTQNVNVYYPRAIHPLYPANSFDCILHDLLMRKRTLSKQMLIPMESKSDLNFVLSEMAK